MNCCGINGCTNCNLLVYSVKGGKPTHAKNRLPCDCDFSHKFDTWKLSASTTPKMRTPASCDANLRNNETGKGMGQGLVKILGFIPISVKISRYTGFSIFFASPPRAFHSHVHKKHNKKIRTAEKMPRQGFVRKIGPQIRDFKLFYCRMAKFDHMCLERRTRCIGFPKKNLKNYGFLPNMEWSNLCGLSFYYNSV
jgi:hypothetical protein